MCCLCVQSVYNVMHMFVCIEQKSYHSFSLLVHSAIYKYLCTEHTDPQYQPQQKQQRPSTHHTLVLYIYILKDSIV